MLLDGGAKDVDEDVDVVVMLADTPPAVDKLRGMGNGQEAESPLWWLELLYTGLGGSLLCCLLCAAATLLGEEMAEGSQKGKTSPASQQPADRHEEAVHRALT